MFDHFDFRLKVAQDDGVQICLKSQGLELAFVSPLKLLFDITMENDSRKMNKFRLVPFPAKNNLDIEVTKN